VADDGKGFAPEAQEARPGHLGMVGMRERALAIGARFAAEAADDGGTMIRLEWGSGA
jgi:signal transduction histidine kinase